MTMNVPFKMLVLFFKQKIKSSNLHLSIRYMLSENIYKLDQYNDLKFVLQKKGV